MSSQKQVLVAVLDWGLGHATRCVPVIQAFLNQGCKVSLAGNGQSLQLLKQEFPQLNFHELISYNIKYSASLPFMFKVFIQLPKFLKAIRIEHGQLQKLIGEHKYDAIVSDNRYGCWSPLVPSAILTHQVNLIMPTSLAWLAGVINFFNHGLLKRFDICWIPDFKKERITGKLSLPGKLKVRFVGMLSRFVKAENVPVDQDLVLAVISGPEPQREILESLLERQMAIYPGKCMVVRGIPTGPKRKHSKVIFINHLKTQELGELIQKANILIARSGYSTIMDLAKLGIRNVILIPTPGQTEQEYLAAELAKKGIALRILQAEFDLDKSVRELIKCTGFEGIKFEPNLIHESIVELLEMKK